ncbi:MAG: glycosyltransferase family 39 protein [candidate division Zixibacteria bacterium]|nr:glycosyltransferase family 39 protein [candidate division Zixibacteria bacterium]
MNDSEKKPIKNTYFLYLILLLAVLIRLLYLYQYSHLPDWDQLTIDNHYHHNWARTIADGNIFGDTTYFRAPFYIYCLGLLYALFGASLWVGRFFGLTLGLGSIILTYLLGRRIFNVKVGLGAALIQALYPVIIFFESELLLDPLFMVFLQLALYRFMVWRDKGGWGKLIIAGISFGLASITRPTGLVAAGVILLVLLLKDKKINRVNIRTTAGFLVSLVIVIAPVTVRNLIVADDPVLIASQGGINLYIGNNDAADGTSAALPEPLGINWHIRDITFAAEKETGRTLRPGEVSSYWTGKALHWITSHPVKFFSLYLKKLYFAFANLEISNNRDIYAFFYNFTFFRFNPLSFGIILPLAVISAAVAWRRSQTARLLVIIMSIYLLISSVFFVSARFRLPLLPFYFILAVFGLGVVMDFYKTSLKKGVAVTFLAVLIAFLSFYTLFPPSRKGFTQTLVSKGLYYIHIEDYPRAILYLKEALAYEQDFLETNLNLGVCYLRLGRTDSALYYFNREKINFPERPKAFNNLASLYLVNDRVNEALGEIEISLSLKPYDPVANMIYLRAVALKEEISNDSLSALITAASQRTGADIYLLNEAAALMLHRQDMKRAESLLLVATIAEPPPIETDDYAFSKEFRNSPENIAREKAKAFHQLGYLKGIGGDFSESVRFSREAVKYNPELSDAYINLISGYLSSGNKPAADSVFHIAVQKFPDNPQLERLRALMKP